LKNLKKPFEVGPLFLEMMDAKFLKSYGIYAIEYEATREVLLDAMKNPQFANFRKTVERNSICQNHGLEDYLISIIQRIPQYIMLLSQLLECTPRDHKDYAAVKLSFIKMKEVAEEVNRKKRQKETLYQLQKIHSVLNIKKSIQKNAT